MNKTMEDHKGSPETVRGRWTFRIIEVSVFVALTLFAIVYDRSVKPLTITELLTLTFGVIVLWILVAASAAWFFSRPHDLLSDMRRELDRYQKQGDQVINDMRRALDRHQEQRDQLTFELQATLRQALASQPYVSEDVLSIIEKDATNIWVISTDLRTT